MISWFRSKWAFLGSFERGLTERRRGSGRTPRTCEGRKLTGRVCMIAHTYAYVRTHIRTHMYRYTAHVHTYARTHAALPFHQPACSEDSRDQRRDQQQDIPVTKQGRATRPATCENDLAPDRKGLA